MTPKHEHGAQGGGVWALALGALVFYSSIFFVKTSMFSAQYHGAPRVLGLERTAALAAAQTMGYLVGKAPALAFAPKLEHRQLLPALLGILWSSGGLVIASTAAPPALGVFCVFLACVCLSPSWYVLQRTLEGRAQTEALLSVVSLSLIGVAGLAKALGAELLERGLSAPSMIRVCALGGVAFGSVAALVVGSQPPPSAADVRLRGSRERVVSLRLEGAQLVKVYGTGLALSGSAFVLSGVLRAFRDFYQAELLAAVGLEGSPSAFASSELLISVLVLGATACFSRVQDSLLAIRLICMTGAAGGSLVALVSAGRMLGAVSGYAWIVGTGAGTFLVYVPVSAMLYDRLIAAANEKVTSTPLALVGDTCVLLATACVLAGRHSGGAQEDGAGGGGGREESAGSAAERHAATARFFARLALASGLAAAALMGASGFALTAAVRRQRRRQQRVSEESSEATRLLDDGSFALAGHARGESRHLASRRSSVEDFDLEPPVIHVSQPVKRLGGSEIPGEPGAQLMAPVLTHFTGLSGRRHTPK